MKALVIGGAGFVGNHLIMHLKEQDDINVLTTKMQDEIISDELILLENVYTLDVLNSENVFSTIKEIKPDYIFHLAAQSSVAISWKNPLLTYNVNIIGSLNILEAVRALGLNCRILFVGSSEEYGIADIKKPNVKEDIIINPTNPYAISKAAQEMTAKMYAAVHGMETIMVRAFNHIGPGQSPNFVMSDFAKQLAEIEKGFRNPEIYVGNLDVKRDFTDVRDVVRAYWLLMQKGRRGEVYNVGSSVLLSVRELLNKLIEYSYVQTVKVVCDKSKYRQIETSEFCADIGKITADTGWYPEIPIGESLKDVLYYWRQKC